ncbi:MAG: stage III sporulation protein AE [Ruminococcus sp.]|nr:stage III sporulation protein AE [Ruminococcus sp.]
MKRMIKLAIWMLSVLLLLFLTGYSVSAEQASVPEELISASGAEELTEVLEPDIQDVLDKYGIEAGNPDAVDGLGVGEVLEGLWQTAMQQMKSPLQVFFLLIAVVICTSLLQGMQGGLQGGLQQMSDLIVVMAASAAAVPPVCDCFLRVKETLTQCADFMSAFTPVFAGILITSGSPGAGLGYQTAVYALVSMIMQIIGSVLLPVLSMCAALAIADAVSSHVSLGGLLRFTRTCVTWLLGLLMTVFLGVLSIQGIVRGATDSFASKTARYVVSNFVPFIGGAVSDAYSTVLGSLKILRSSTGLVGIVTLCILFLPVLVQLVLYRFAVSGAAAVSELFSAGALTKLLRGLEQVLQMTLAVLICFSVMFLVAIALVLLLSSGSAAG